MIKRPAQKHCRLTPERLRDVACELGFMELCSANRMTCYSAGKFEDFIIMQPSIVSEGGELILELDVGEMTAAALPGVVLFILRDVLICIIEQGDGKRMFIEELMSSLDDLLEPKYDLPGLMKGGIEGMFTLQAR